MPGEIIPEDVGAACITPTEAQRREIDEAARFAYGVVVLACQKLDVNLCAGVEERALADPRMVRFIPDGTSYRRPTKYERTQLLEPPELDLDICCEPMIRTTEFGNEEGDRWFAARELTPVYSRTILMATVPTGPHRKKDQGPTFLTQIALHPPTLTQMVEEKGVFPTYEAGLDDIEGQDLSSDERLAKIVEHVKKHAHRGPKCKKGPKEGYRVPCVFELIINAQVEVPD